jgi:hypothetical protein
VKKGQGWSNPVRKEKLIAPTYEPPTTETATIAFTGAKEAGEEKCGYRREVRDALLGFDCFGDGIAVTLLVPSGVYALNRTGDSTAGGSGA